VTRRKAGIIAAGRGERLRRGVDALKPLVAVAGRPLVSRVLTSIAETSPAEVTIIINDDSTEVRDVVQQSHWPFELQWIVETTPSSMHSFLRVVEALALDGSAGPFLLSTVDTVAAPGAYRAFASAAAAIDADVVLAVNEPGADEKPLLVSVDDRGIVTALGDAVGRAGQQGRPLCATAGFYMVRAAILREAQTARSAGLSALRLFFSHLLARGCQIAAVPVARSIDVDHPPDIGAAEAFLEGSRA
jgi:NDP-sugar pyrophosphorylase family protein